jgi:AraC family transcriptional regulator
MLDGPGELRRRRFGADRRAATHAMLSVIPDDAGPKVTTFRRGVVHSTRPPGSQTFLARDHFFSVMLAPSPGITAAFASDKMQAFDAPTGMIVVSPANVESKGSFSSSRENAVIAIEPGNLAELAARELDMGHVDLQIPAFGTVDPVALHMAQLFKAELRQGPPNELYVDSLITLFGIHLLRNYTSGRKSPMKVKGGLPVESARRLQDYMAENFAGKLSVAELAAICDLSPNHFIHAFTRTFGEQPYRYLIGLRLDHAEKLLLGSELPYGMVATMSGFSSQSHLTATMSRFKGTTPAKIRLNK